MKMLLIVVVAIVALAVPASASAAPRLTPAQGKVVHRLETSFEKLNAYDVYRTEAQCERRVCSYALFIRGLYPKATDQLCLGWFKWTKHAARRFSQLTCM